MEKPTKKKVIAYILRRAKHLSYGNELLVFEHEPQYSAGIQVVGGTVEPGEDLLAAVEREVLEESGLKISHEKWTFLGESFYHRKDLPEINHRHYFMTYIQDAPDRWEHRVLSKGEDHNMTFSFYWLHFDEATHCLTGNFAELLPLIPA
jgi:8-oxo-dGTP pyrophosphatase MutT (NUDIX family)